MLRTEEMDKNGPFYIPPSLIFHMGRSIPPHSDHNAFSNKAHFHGNVLDGRAYLGLPNTVTIVTPGRPHSVHSIF